MTNLINSPDSYQPKPWQSYAKRYPPKPQYGRTKEEWETKDLATEFNILTAQAYNLAYGRLGGEGLEAVYEEVKGVINELLRLRQDKEVIVAFRNFKSDKINEKARKVEQADRGMDEGLNDLGQE